ncbi:TetR/AcrR family transcriptional regulator [Saccharothrix variisporea]|uniref:TetR family transcriptional regulator n=1 Tax=Saccharothrix variisporea TaxID=543527 RepID=A0A495XJJ3_9PSEU|nr:TetR/AcrR family transcriptional regulator C-terminal domain-containing protein [Saccharothrix variisporea]RKT74152.1 TetR family transcriptional regulator [Saccharothrix variisporea]
MGKPGPKRTLSEDAIVAAALEVLDERGADAVSVRSIAARVGIAPNAVYTYFPDKAAVLRAVVDRLIGEQSLAVLAGDEPWQDRIRTVALGLRSSLLRHPGAATLLMSAPMDGPRALEFGERLLDVLSEAGFTPEDAARLSYALIVYILGAIALEAAEVDPSRPAPPEEERIALRRNGFAKVPADTFPRTAAAAEVMARYVSTEQFLWGLDRVLGRATIPS